MKGFDYSKLKESKFYDRLRPIGKALLVKGLFKIEYTGLENIPEDGGYIVASNHIHALDPVFIALGMKRQIHVMGKQELFKNPLIKAILTKLNGFPVVRGARDRQALDYAVRIIREKMILGMFPEGTRSKTFTPARAKAGVALIAKEAKADILPVAIYNDKKMKSGSKITVRFGKPIPFEELGLNDESTKEELRASANNVMDKIVALWEEGHCE